MNTSNGNVKLSIVGTRPTDEEVKNFKPLSKPNADIGKNVDAYFMQEISDRLFGPDSHLYIAELNKLHQKIRKRAGKCGNQFYEERQIISN